MTTADRGPTLPPRWAYATIGEVIPPDGVFIDGDWVESKDQDPNGGVRLIQLADVGDGLFIDKSDRHLTKKKAYELGCTFLKKGDVLVARMPEPLGRCCIFPLIGDDRYVTVVDVCVVRLSDSSADPKYLMHLINSPGIRAAIADFQSGSTRKRISRGNLAKIRLPIAPLEEQRRIVAKVEELFSELDSGVEALSSAREQLKGYRQSVLKHAFEGKLTEAWRQKNADKLQTADEIRSHLNRAMDVRYEQQLRQRKAAVEQRSPGKLPETQPARARPPVAVAATLDQSLGPFKLPDGWSWVPLSWLLSTLKKPMTTGPFGTLLKKHEHRATGVPVLGIENIGKGQFLPDNKIFVSEEKSKELSAFAVEAGDLVISRSGTVGEICEVPDGLGTALISTNLMRISLNHDIVMPGFFVYMFQGGGSVRTQVKELCKGSSRDFLNQSILESIWFPLCSLAEQQKVLERISEQTICIDSLSVEIETELERSKALRDAVLRKAFSGQLVPQDPQDEPADALLERIRVARERAITGRERVHRNGRKEAA